MKFDTPLIKTKFIKRYKRFFVDVLLNKEILTAHCPNSGSMMGLLNEGENAWISESKNTKRKLKYTLEISTVTIILRPQMSTSTIQP